MSRVVYASVTVVGLILAYVAGTAVSTQKKIQKDTAMAELLRRGVDGEDYPVATIYGYGDKNYEVCREQIATILNNDLEAKREKPLFSCR